MACLQIRCKDDVIKMAERFAMTMKMHIVVVQRRGRHSFYEKTYVANTDKIITEFDFTEKETKIEEDNDKPEVISEF